MIKFLQFFKKFCKGFFICEYKYELPSKPNLNGVSLLLNMGGEFSKTISSILNLPAENINFGIKSYEVTKYNNVALEREIIQKEKSISFTKVNLINIRSIHKREINVTNTIFSIGIDGKMWRFQFNVYVMYNSLTTEYDNKFIEFCNKITNHYIDVLNLDVMCKYKLNVSNIYTQEELSARSFDGRVFTYGYFDDSQIFGINEVLPNPIRPDQYMCIESIHRNSIDETIKEESLLFDVIRRDKPHISDESVREISEDFKFKVISKKSVGEVKDINDSYKLKGGS